MDLGPAAAPTAALGPAAARGHVDRSPIPDARVLPPTATRPTLAVARESIRLAFVAALQHLPPRQRAVLILREVLRWQAERGRRAARHHGGLGEQRAAARPRDDGRRCDVAADRPAPPVDDDQRELLARYVDAFERYDIDALVEPARTRTRPSRCRRTRCGCSGRDEILAWWLGPGIGCRGSRLVPTSANGRPAFGQYRPSGPDGEHEPWALQIIEVSGGRIVEFASFLDTASLFPLFGLPPTLD